MRHYYVYLLAVLLLATNGSVFAQRGGKRGNSLQVYKDSAVFTLRQYGDMSTGNGILHPQRFRMQLPKQLSKYELMTHNYTLFHYPQGQYIMVKVNPTPSPQIKAHDSSWVPSYAYISREVDLNPHLKDETPFVARGDRRSQVFRRRGNEIMLINIKPENYQAFEQAISTFRILPDSIPVIRAFPK